MREYRWKYRLYSFVVPQSWYGVLFHARRGARRKVFRACGEKTSPRCFSANCAAPEPSERRAKTGLYKRTIFWTREAFIWLSFFIGRWGAFLWYDFPEKAVMPIVQKRCAMTGFYKSTIFKRKAVVIVCFKTRRDGVLRYLKLLPSGAKRHLSKSCRYRNHKFILRL